MSLEDRIRAAQERLRAEQAQQEKALAAAEAEVVRRASDERQATDLLAKETENLARVRAERMQVELEIEALLIIISINHG